jgi:hypothetical protein
MGLKTVHPALASTRGGTVATARPATAVDPFARAARRACPSRRSPASDPAASVPFVAKNAADMRRSGSQPDQSWWGLGRRQKVGPEFPQMVTRSFRFHHPRDEADAAVSTHGSPCDPARVRVAARSGMPPEMTADFEFARRRPPTPTGSGRPNPAARAGPWSSMGVLEFRSVQDRTKRLCRSRKSSNFESGPTPPDRDSGPDATEITGVSLSNRRPH